MSDVLFKECTQSEYSSITPDNNTFYKIQDSNANDLDVFLGATKLNDITNMSTSEPILNISTNKEVSIDIPLNILPWAEIASLVQQGQAENLWSIGDTTSLITLNGSLGDYLTFKNYQCRAILIDFDHNKDLETDDKNSITLQFGKDEFNNTNIAFVDSRFTEQSSDYNCLNMNMSDTNAGGWESSHMRNNICPQFLELLPTDLQKVINTVTKYTDNVGGGTGNIESNITATQDKVFLLSYYELGYTSTYANSYEANYTEPYSGMYTNDSDRIKYQHSAVDSDLNYFERSPYQYNERAFCFVRRDGGESYGAATFSRGFAPVIVIY